MTSPYIHLGVKTKRTKIVSFSFIANKVNQPETFDSKAVCALNKVYTILL